MSENKIEYSSSFKKNATTAVFAIILFILSYLVLLSAAIVLTIACIYLGYSMIVIAPGFFSIVLGIGCGVLGLLILFFLIKFIFKQKKIDRSHFIHIRRSDEPKLFEMIDEIVHEVDTKAPKKVYLSPDVNAAVFYDSSFWSMFLPVRKNLIIGMGLVNTLSVDELKAILCHEFGHFSQQSMKIGTYVYNVNHIIFDLLNDNESLNKVIGFLGNFGFISLFAFLGVKIIEGIQWILKQMYGIVNRAYMALSREMEFHADEIAASITGSAPLSSSLLRLSLAEMALNNTYAFHEARLDTNERPENIYEEQSYVMTYFGKQNNLEFRHGLPFVTLEETKKFNKSKLIIKDQWASHPSYEERIAHIAQFNQPQNTQPSPAASILQQAAKWQKQLTRRIFKHLPYKQEPTLKKLDDFIPIFHTDYQENTFHTLYKGYYDVHNPIFPLNKDISSDSTDTFEALFQEKEVEKIYVLSGLIDDLEIIKSISKKELDVKYFDYNGTKYNRKQCTSLINTLEKELSILREDRAKHDQKIYTFFKQLESTKQADPKIDRFYDTFLDFDTRYKAYHQVYIEIIPAMDFFQFQLSWEQILDYLEKLKKEEKKLKSSIQEIVKDDLFNESLTPEMKENFELYTSYSWDYIRNSRYEEKNLNILFKAVNDYSLVLNKTYFSLKKQLLSYQVELLEHSTK